MKSCWPSGKRRGCLSEFAAGDPEDAQAVVGHEGRLPVDAFQFVAFVVAQVGDRFGSSLGRHDTASGRRVSPHPSDGQQIVGQGVLREQLPVVVQVLGPTQLGGAQRLEGDLHRVERPALAREHGVLEQLVQSLGDRPRSVPHREGRGACAEGLGPRESGHRHAVLRQGARLVDAKGRHRTQGLDRRHAAGQHSTLREAPGTQRQEDGQYDGELLGHHGHRQGQSGEEPFEPVAAGQTVAHDHHAAEAQAGKRKPAYQAVDLALQARALRMEGGERLADASDLGRRAGLGDQRRALPSDDQGAREHVGGVVSARTCVGCSAGPFGGSFGDGDRFAGQERLVDAQVRTAQERAVGRHSVAFAEHHQIARHDVPAGDALLPIAHV